MPVALLNTISTVTSPGLDTFLTLSPALDEKVLFAPASPPASAHPPPTPCPLVAAPSRMAGCPPPVHPLLLSPAPGLHCTQTQAHIQVSSLACSPSATLTHSLHALCALLQVCSSPQCLTFAKGSSMCSGARSRSVEALFPGIVPVTTSWILPELAALHPLASTCVFPPGPAQSQNWSLTLASWPPTVPYHHTHMVLGKPTCSILWFQIILGLCDLQNVTSMTWPLPTAQPNTSPLHPLRNETVCRS